MQTQVIDRHQLEIEIIRKIPQISNNKDLINVKNLLFLLAAKNTNPQQISLKLQHFIIKLNNLRKPKGGN